MSGSARRSLHKRRRASGSGAPRSSAKRMMAMQTILRARCNLARIAVETACLDVLRIAQRALGLAAFRQGELAELLLRDLATYLRQPAPDETLAEAAAHFMQRAVPETP